MQLEPGTERPTALSMASDEQLAQMARDRYNRDLNDSPMLDVLIGRYRTAAFATAHSTLIRGTEAEERCQIALIAIVKSARTWSPDGGASFRTYLNRILVREMINIHRTTCERGRIPPKLIGSMEVAGEDGSVLDVGDSIAGETHDFGDLAILPIWRDAFEEFVFQVVYDIRDQELSSEIRILLDLLSAVDRGRVRKCLQSSSKQMTLILPSWVYLLVGAMDTAGRFLWYVLFAVAEGYSVKDIALQTGLQTRAVRAILGLARSAYSEECQISA